MSEKNTSQKQYIKKSRETLIGADSKRPQAQKGMGGPRGVITESSDNFGASWKNLLSYAKPQMVAIVIAMLCAVIGTVISLIGPKQIQKITDLITAGVTGSIDLDAVTATVTFLLILYGISWLMNFLQHFIMATVAPTISNRMRTDISDKTNRMPLKYFDSTSFGDILSRITNDIDTIERTLNLSIAQFITSIALFIGSAVMMFITNWILALTAIVASVLGFFLMSVIMKRSQLHFNRQQRHLGAINGHVEEIYSGHNIVKAYNYEKESKEEFSRINRHLRDSVFKSTALSGVMQPLMTFIGNLGFVAVFVVGALLVKDAVITFGVIIEFTIYVRLFTQPLQQLAQSFSSMQSTAAAADRVFEYLDEEELSDESGKTRRLC